MKIVSILDVDNRCVYTSCKGLITLEDFLSYHQTTWGKSELYGFNELFDAREGDFSGIYFSDLLTVAKQASGLITLAPDSRAAIVITPAQDELGQFYQAAKSLINTPTRETQLFFDIDAARDWLG